MAAYALLAEVSDRPGMISDLTRVLADHHANITYVDIHDAGEPVADIYFEFTAEQPSIEPILTDMRQVNGVRLVEETPNFARIYGKRIIVMGGGAQVGLRGDGRDHRGRSPQHPRRADLDRHHSAGRRAGTGGCRARDGAAAAREDAGARRIDHGRRDHRGGERGAELRPARHLVEQAGSVPDAADLVVSDPVQAGVMAVMAVADTAKFDLMKQLKKRY